MNRQIAQTLPITLELVAVAFALAVIVSLLLGSLSALYRDGPLDYMARIIAVLGLSVPGFWLALVLVLFLAVERDWFPPGGMTPWSAGWLSHVRSLTLPCVCLGIYYMAVITRMTRSSLLDVLGQDYMRTARSLGLSKARILSYALRNALVPVVTVAGVSFGHMFALGLIIEYVFNIDGMSSSLLTAIKQRDYAMVQAVVMVFTVIFVLSNLLADLVNAGLNPRLRAGVP